MFNAESIMKTRTLAGQYFLMLLVALNVASVSPGHAQSESFPLRSVMIIDLTPVSLLV